MSKVQRPNALLFQNLRIKMIVLPISFFVLRVGVEDSSRIGFSSISLNWSLIFNYYCNNLP